MTYEYRHVLNEIRHEIDSNMSYYTQLPGINSVFELHRLLCAYIDGKNYDTPLGDCLPMILSNALHFNVVIIHRSAQSTDPIIIFPRISSNRFVYIYKCGDHYEGIEANICFDPVVGILSPTMYSNSNAYLETAQAKSVSARPILPSEGEGTHHSLKPKVMLWNIYGIHENKLEVNDTLLRKQTVIATVETWSRGDIAEDIFPGYKYQDFFRPDQNRNSVRGAGGIGIFIKEEFLDHITIYRSYKDIIVWIKFCKKYFKLSNDLLLGVVYCYPESSACLTEDIYVVLFQEIASIPMHFDKLMLGDWNARIGAFPDWSPDIFRMNSEGDMTCFPQIQTDDFNDDETIAFIEYLRLNGILNRVSQDKIEKPNKYGHSLIDLCILFRMFVLNGRSGRDKGVGSVSFISNYRGTSLVDYLIGTPKTFMLVENFGFETKLPESDHIPMTFTLNCSFFQNNNNKTIKKGNWSNHKSYKWNRENLPQLNTLLTDDKSKSFHDTFLCSMINHDSTNSVASSFHDFFSQACKRFCPLKKHTFNYSDKKPDWFDSDLVNKRNEVISAGERICSDTDLSILRNKSKVAP